MKGRKSAVTTVGLMVTMILLTAFCSLAQQVEMVEPVVKEYVIDPDIRQMHEEMLYCTVRVVSKKLSGSGTIIYSQPNANGVVETYVITCYHVIDNQVTIEDKWDPAVGKIRKKETRGTVRVEFFIYNDFSNSVGTTGKKADIVAYDTSLDIALLKLRDKEQPAEYVAAMYPLDALQELHIFKKLWGIGAALSHAPLPTFGHLASVNDEINNEVYWMSTAASVFGDSGGSIYTSRVIERVVEEDGTITIRTKYYLLGIPAKLPVAQMGFSVSLVMHMGYFVPAPSIYGFLTDNFYQFIHDDSVTSEECLKMRQARDAMEKKNFTLQLQAQPVGK